MNLKLDKIDAYGCGKEKGLIEKFKLLNNHHYKNSKEYKKF